MTMQDITFTLGNFTTVKTVSDQDMTRIFNAIKSYCLRGLPDGVQLTDQNVFDTWVASRTESLKALVRSEEGEAAAKVAKNAIVDLDVK